MELSKKKSEIKQALEMEDENGKQKKKKALELLVARSISEYSNFFLWQKIIFCSTLEMKNNCCLMLDWKFWMKPMALLVTTISWLQCITEFFTVQIFKWGTW